MNVHSLPCSARLSALIAMVCLCVGMPGTGHALTTDLSITPPDLNASVAPNIALTFDDSGSMSFGYMPDSVDDNYSDRCGWKYAWHGFNRIYYNPDISYDVPLDKDGVPFPASNVVWPNVPFDGYHTYLGFGATTINLSKDYRLTYEWDRDADHDNNALSSDCIPAGAKSGSDEHAFYARADGTVVDLTGAGIGSQGRSDAEERQNFANWYSYYRVRNLLTKTAISRAFAKFDSNVRVVWQTIWPYASSRPWSVDINTNSTIGEFTGTRKTNFFNWLFKIESSNGTPDRKATVRAGDFFKRALTQNSKDPYWNGETGDDSSDLSCRQNFHMLVTDGYWNESDSEVTAASITSGANQDLPGTPDYLASGTNSSIYWNVTDNKTWNKSLANIAFSYWAKDLQPGLADKVPPFFPDKTTGVTGTVDFDPEDNPRDNVEIFYNPANNPAIWQHLVQFMVTLGVNGTLNYPGDLEALRKGTKAWPKTVADGPASIDDVWHAAVNSRGAYFSANNPQELVEHLANLVQNILIRRGSSTALSATMSILTQGTQGFTAGYDTSDWSGFLAKRHLDPVTGEPGDVIWDAGCLLTGNGCLSGTDTVATAPDPDAREIFTWGSSGNEFKWADLTTPQKLALRATGETDDTNAELRLEYLRGDRSQESAVPLMRKRGSVLGAIINSQPVFVSGPTGGFSDSFPTDSPEAEAAATDSYSKFLYDNRDREPTVYAGANDGMLHAFNAIDGSERWAYVPNMLFGNGKLRQLTDRTSTTIVPGVDDMPVVQDAFFDGEWHTVLIGSMRLGARGIFAIDVTDPDAPTVLWEFSNASAGGADLGYTYGSANIARLHCNSGNCSGDGGTWVVLLSSGYFPHGNTESAADRTSLLVLDLETGNLVRQIPTVAGVTTFGLSTPAAYDANSDQVDDFAVAGDLAGNLWRFDLRSDSPSVWSADLMFKTYTSAPTAAAPPVQPISVMPVALRDLVAGTPVWVFGTGKYLGAEDRLATGTPSNIGPQAFYGIRDNGPGSATIEVSDLVEQTLAQDAAGVRTLTRAVVPLENGGWMFTLDPDDDEPGERNVVTAIPLYASNRAVLTTLIPKGNDPCDPGRRGAIMVVDAGIGGAPTSGAPVLGGSPGAGSGVVGKAFDSDAISSISPPALVGQQGGGGILIPGIPEFKIPDPPYHRGAWRELLDIQ